MSSRFDNLDEYEDPPIMPRPSWCEWLTVFVIAAAILAAVALVHGAEVEKQVLYIYTDAAHCAPCRQLEKSLAKEPMSQFKVVRLPPPHGCSIPCIAYWKSDGKPGYFIGWGGDSEAKFLSQWKRDAKR